jgi:hypothetical protein
MKISDIKEAMDLTKLTTDPDKLDARNQIKQICPR